MRCSESLVRWKAADKLALHLICTIFFTLKQEIFTRRSGDLVLPQRYSWLLLMSLEDTGAKYYLRPSWSETFLIPRELLP